MVRRKTLFTIHMTNLSHKQKITVGNCYENLYAQRILVLFFIIILNTVCVLYEFFWKLGEKVGQIRWNHKKVNSKALYLTPLQTNKTISN